jgi:hypothetical protein
VDRGELLLAAAEKACGGIDERRQLFASECHRNRDKEDSCPKRERRYQIEPVTANS